MISLLVGTVAGQERDDRLVVACGGVGYSVHVGKRDRKAVEVYGKAVTVYARQVWNEALGPSLFGWLNERDRDFFDRLLKVDGIGPKRAVALVDAFDVDDFNEIITTGDTRVIAKCLDGVGAKTIEKLKAEWKVPA